jgi:phosphoglucomutase
MLVNVTRLVSAYYTERPNPSVPEQRVAFGTSGQRGSALDPAFNEWHILAITQAICLYRGQHGIDGPLFLGMDTRALSVPAFSSALEVLAANGVELMIALHEYTPTPVISHAILAYNSGRNSGFADGIVIPERVYKIYTESFEGPEHLRCLVEEAQRIAGDALATAKALQRSKGRSPSALSERTP